MLAKTEFPYPKISWEFSISHSLLNIENVNFWWINNVEEMENIKRNELSIDTYYAIEYILQEINKIYKNNIKSTKIKTKNAVCIVLQKIKKSKNIWDIALYQKIKISLLEEDNTKLLHDSLTDSLTWLPNRRFLEKEIKNIIALKNRHWRDSSILMIDIDFFKKINDTYWHDVWDITLIEISNILNEEFRETDIVWRLGWEEFIVILKRTKISTAEKKANKIRKKIQENLWIEIPEIGKKITVSIWVSQTIEWENSWKHILKRADKALYEAKDRWRNIVKSEY